MSPFQVLSVIACCVAVFVGVVTFLSSQGVSLPLAVLSVYLFAVACMLGMQRRARESCENTELGASRHRGDPSLPGVDRDDAGVGESERVSGYVATGLREFFRSGT